MENNKQKSTPPSDDDLVIAVKKYLRDNWEKGVHCPCCGQFVKLYRRKITSAMAWGLVLVYNRRKFTNEKTFHLEKFLKNQDCPSSIRGDMSKLCHWQFLVKRPDLGVGYYELLPLGEMFVRNEITVPRAVFIYNAKVYKRSNEQTNIREALKDKFNIDELLGNEIRSENPTRSADYAQQELW